MKNLILMFSVLLCSLSSFGQKYAKVLDQAINPADLEYMPMEELRLLKNELIATKGADLKSISTPSETPKSFLDSISEANVNLITKTERSKSTSDKSCSHQELVERFRALLENKQKIPFYLQVLFLNNCQDPASNIYLLPVSENFLTIAISENPKGGVGPEQHKIITLDLAGVRIDTKSMNGKAQFKENKIIHESYNSLIEYTYTISDEGKFDKKTPTKGGR